MWALGAGQRVLRHAQHATGDLQWVAGESSQRAVALSRGARGPYCAQKPIPAARRVVPRKLWRVPHRRQICPNREHPHRIGSGVHSIPPS